MRNTAIKCDLNVFEFGLNAVPDFPDIESALFAHLLVEADNVVPSTLFVLGAPRTGSTILYQVLCSRFGLPYIANLTNDHFAETPIVGLAIQKALPEEIAYTSSYGKTQGAFQLSEGSAIMKHWFGGGHPSALVSTTVKDGMQEHFLTTLRAAESLFERPLVIKNGWNCFRIRCLAEALPHARFVWIRRDIAAAAKSDLAARYAIRGTPTAWNSATPANVEELRKLPPAAQVVENQYTFNAAIGTSLRSHAAGRWTQVWYEDFCRDAVGTLDRLAATFGIAPVVRPADIKLTRAGGWELSHADMATIDAYIAERSGHEEA